MHKNQKEARHLKNSSAAALTDFKSARSNLRKQASFPVNSLRSLIAFSDFVWLRAAMYTLALCESSAYAFGVSQKSHEVTFKHTLTVSNPIPALPKDKEAMVSGHIPESPCQMCYLQ